MRSETDSNRNLSILSRVEATIEWFEPSHFHGEYKKKKLNSENKPKIDKTSQTI